MSNSMQFALQIQAGLSGNLISQLSAVQNSLNAVKGAANFASNLNVTPKMQQSLAELQRLQNKLNDIQNYKQALRDKQKLQQQFQKQVQKNSQAAADKQAAKQNLDNLKIQLESFKAAQVGLKRTSQEYKNLQNQIKQTKAEIKSANEALKVADTNFKSSQNKTRDIGQNLSQQISRLRQLQGALSSAGVNVNSLAAAEMRLQSSINSTTQALARQQATANRRMQLRANFDNASDNLSNKYQNFQNAVGTAETIMNPFTSATQMAMDYQYQMKAIEAKTQFEDIRAGNFEKVNAEMSKLDATAKRLGATTEYTATEVARSMDKFAMSGYAAQDIDRIIPSFINIGTITKTAGENLERLADTYTDDFAAMGYKVGQKIQLNNGGGEVSAEKYFENVYGYALNKSNMDSESFHNAVKYFAPVTSALGLRGSESIAMAMFNASAGQKGSQFGNALKTGLMRMVAPTKMTREALDAMGMADMDLSDAMKASAETQAVLKQAMPEIDTHDFLGMLQGIKTYLDTLDDGEKVGWLGAVVGKNAAPVWTKLFADPHGVEELIKNAQFMESMGINNYTSDVSQTYRESAKIQWEMLKSSWDANIQQIGYSLLPTVIQLSQSLAPILTSTAEWLAQNQELVVALAKIAAAISAIIVAAAGIQLIGAAFGMVKASALLASGAISTAVTFLRGLSFAGIASSISGIGTAFMAAARGAMAFIFTPVGAAVAAIAAAAYLIYSNWDKVGPVFESAADALKSAFGGAVEWLSEKLDFLSEKFSALKEFFHLDFNFAGGKKFDFTPGNFNQPQVSTLPNIPTPQIQQVQTAQTQITNVPTLDLNQIQSQIDFLGNSLNRQSLNFNDFNTTLTAQTANLNSTLSNVLNSAESVKTSTLETQAQLQSVGTSISESQNLFQNVSTSLSENAANVQNLNTSVTENAAQFSALNTSITSNAAEISNQTAAIQTSITSIQNMTQAAETSISSIQNMAASADNSTSSISNLATSASSAASSLSGLGGAVSSAIASIHVAGANAAAAIPTASVANNYNGGIHTGGAFLSWINEKGPEAIIPLDGSQNAKNLWQATGKILGVENNFGGGIYGNYKSGGYSSAFVFNPISKILEVFKSLVYKFNVFNSSVEIFNSATQSQMEMAQTLQTARENLPDEVKNSKSYKSLMENSNSSRVSNFPLLTMERGKVWGQQTTGGNIFSNFNLPNIFSNFNLPNIFGNFNLPNIFSNFNLPNIFGNFNLPNIFSNFNLPNIFSNFNLPNIFSNFNLPNIFERVLNLPTGTSWNPNLPNPNFKIGDIFGNRNFPVLNEVGTFPQLEGYGGVQNSAQNQSSFAPVFNITINANSELNGRQLAIDFESEFEDYLKEYQRRAFF